MNKVQTCKSAVLCPSLLTVVVHWLNEFYEWWVLWSRFWDFVVAFCVCVIGTKIGYFSPILMWIIGRGYKSDGLAFLQLGSSSQAGSTGDNKYMRLCHQRQWKIWQCSSIASESLHKPRVKKIFCDHPLLVCKLFLLKKCTAKCLAFSMDDSCLKMKTLWTSCSLPIMPSYWSMAKLGFCISPCYDPPISSLPMSSNEPLLMWCLQIDWSMAKLSFFIYPSTQVSINFRLTHIF
jgi:hypothetical protein